MNEIQVTDDQVIEAMTARTSGSFAQALGAAARRADPSNLAKIKAAFPEMWEVYANAAAYIAIVEARCDRFQLMHEAAGDHLEVALGRRH